MEDRERGKLTYHKWYTDKVDIYRKNFTNEQMGELFFAVLETVETSEIVEVSDGIRFAYELCCIDVEAARKAYKKRCETNARNGAKGGKAKADNMKKASKAPTETEFDKIVQDVCTTEGLSYTAEKSKELYTKFNANEWKMKNKAADADLIKAAIYAFFSDDKEKRALEVLLTNDEIISISEIKRACNI